MSRSDRDPVNQIQTSLRQTQWLSCGSAAELARMFGRSILEPTWWPPDASPISWSVDVGAGHNRYRIGSHRDDGSPILVIGVDEAEWSGRSPKDWLRAIGPNHQTSLQCEE